MRRISFQVFITFGVLNFADGCVCGEGRMWVTCGRGKGSLGGVYLHWWGKLLGLLWFARLQAIFNHPFCCFHGSCTHPRETIHCWAASKEKAALEWGNVKGTIIHNFSKQCERNLSQSVQHSWCFWSQTEHVGEQIMVPQGPALRLNIFGLSHTWSVWAVNFVTS